ncbi:SOS response-associated peptidase [Starkeya sp. ORNL1]|uniref:SOS response-associated peptidase n=1 Tax=Starkeya sp. ORNL1 TaxID=2709380 RepID=UPI001463F6A3|nr:SOS response-associated peptidase [Starkeya sp. ORNL1]QJP13716.1 SOS response-associated peptidase [Starkeya sp. ORNL1]
MCGRVTQTSGELPGLVCFLGSDHDPRVVDAAGLERKRYNGAPSQDFWVIRRHPETGQNVRDRLRWGFEAPWMRAQKVRPQIIARSDRIATAPMFRDAYMKRRCLLPVDNFFEWDASIQPKQPYGVGLKSGLPFGIAAIWTGYQDTSGRWVRTFAVVTCAANERMARIHDRMPVILTIEGYERWLANIEPDPADLMVPYPSDETRIWPVGPRVNSAGNDDAGVLEPVGEDE